MKFTTRDLVLIPLFTALMVVGAKLSIPFPGVPLTFQLFFCIYSGLLLGARNGLLSQLLYVLLGVIGLPVFTAGGGMQYVVNPTFGYILGFTLCAFVIGLLSQRLKEIKVIKVLFISFVGYAIIYLVGNFYFYAIKGLYLQQDMALLTVFKIMLPFMVKDFALLLVAAITSTKILPVLRKARHY